MHDTQDESADAKIATSSQEYLVAQIGYESISENDKLEYQEAMKLWCFDSGLRRQGLTFITTAQAAIVTVFSSELVKNTVPRIALAALALYISLLGFNNDRRLSAYMSAYEDRMQEIEARNGLKLLKYALAYPKNYKFMPLNAVTFPVFYALIALAWTVAIPFLLLR